MQVPNGSIYHWMYKQGLKHVDLTDIEIAVKALGIGIREKDYANYWNGYYNSDLYKSDIFMLKRGNSQLVSSSVKFFDAPYSSYPEHPYLDMPEIENRWVPCNGNNKPMIQWSQGCMTLADAKAKVGQVYLGENLKGCKFIVIDCDGDHDEGRFDWDTIEFLWKFSKVTHCLMKPKMIRDYKGAPNINRPASFHITFAVDRIIPTMHFPYAHIDIVGNEKNSLRYIKNKIWNGLNPIPMTDEIWGQLQQYIKQRKEKDEWA